MEIEEQFFYENLEQKIDNTYQVLVKEMDIDAILDDESRVDMFLFNPMQGFITHEVMEDLYTLLIEHYEEDERYERCQKLMTQRELDIKNERETL